MIKHKLLIPLICLLIILVSMIAGYIVFLTDQSNLKLHLNDIWRQTVKADCAERMREIGTFKINMYSPIQSSTVKITTKDQTITIIKKDTSQHLAPDAADYQADQIFLSKKKPIQVQKLDSLFQARLKEAGYSFETSVSYYNDLITLQSTFDTNFYIQTYLVEWMNKIADGFIVINGYVKLRPSDYIQQYRRTCLFWGISIIFLIFILFYWLKGNPVVEKTKSKNEIETDNETEVDPKIENEQEGIQQNDLENKPILVYLDCARDTLTCGESSIMLTTLIFKLFLFLSEGKDYFQTYDNIYNELWEKDGGDKKRLEQIVIRLRNELKVIPEIKIVAIRGCGLQLKTDGERGIMIEYTNDDEQKITPI